MTEIAPLFKDLPARLPEGLIFKAQAVPLTGQEALLHAVRDIAGAAPLAQTRVKGGGMTSAAMTNCGAAGWWSDAKGYRYETKDPRSGQPWPSMPEVFLEVVRGVVVGTAWPDFTPDACLINFYGLDAKMGLHQDRDERDFGQPIVTVSLGDAADFIVGGFQRNGPTITLRVASGDAVIMGGASRMRFHGVRRIHPGTSPLGDLGGRFSLTFRRAL